MQNVFIRKRGNKHVVTLEYRDKQSGKRKQKALGSYDKKKEAEDALIEEKSKIINGNFIIPEKITFEQYLKQWLEQHKNNLSVTTYTRYKYIIDKQISPDIGEIELQKLTPLHLENFYYSMLKTLNPKTVLQYHRVIHKAYKLQIINKNISNLVELPKIKKYKAKSLTIKEVKQFLEVSKDTRVEIPINLAIVLGLRAAEILGLSWDNVNFCENTIVICKTLVKDKINKTLVFKEPKSETSIRTLTVPEQLMNLLKEHKKKQKQLQLKSYGAFKNEFNLVFTKLNGNPMASDSLSSTFRDFINRNNLPNIRFHDLRHTNATLMLASGTSMKVASTRLGHSTIGITMDLYTHVLQGLEKEAAKNLSDLIY
ncbi:tyrosine-type recombinase/integrase [Clostridium sporogenes]|uniref:tyrosine-type recombinase/integrase n=1 Tax=Clostridium sporogenes TaxID=1509 RepID=UPI0029052F52|nr:tyrosine-type recombinase/integrase [Clostridium botulinum]